LVVIVSAVDYLISELSCYVLRGTLNPVPAHLLS